MKCSDLQIGDYVKYQGHIYIIEENSAKGWVHLIHPETKARVNMTSDYIINLLEPIPLTRKILEKSGFYFGYTSNEEDLASNTIAQLSEEDKGWVWDEGDGSIKVILPNESDGGMIIIDDQSFDRHLSLVYNNEVYVHELQHLLRSCGVEKSLTI